MLDISLDLYRVFDSVVRAKSFSEAARRLCVSQPAVSQSIRQLEEALDTRLFVRGAKGAQLTREGELFSGYITSAFGLIEAGEQRLSMLNELSAGELRIGASDTVSKRYLLPRIQKFHERYPDVSLSIVNRTSSETVELLCEGGIDIGYVNLPLEAEGVTFERCRTVHDVFVAGEQFSSLRGRKVTLAELAELPLIMLEQAANSRRWVDRHFLSRGVVLRPEIELGAHDLLVDYARIGLGVSCVIDEFADIDACGLFRVELEPPVPERSIGVCYMEGIELSAAARRFIELEV